MGTLLWLKVIVILAVPYLFAGMAISLALTRSPWPISLVYGVDLVGAASGCLVALLALTFIDAVSALFLVAALGALAALFFASAKGAAAVPGEPLLAVARLRVFAHPSILAAGFGLLAFGNAVIQPYGLKLSIVKNQLERARPHTFIRWNSFSRIIVGPNTFASGGTNLMWGPSSVMPVPPIEHRNIEIDGSSGTPMYRFDGNLRKLSFLKYDVTNLAYYIRHAGRAAVIGVGGGRDILSAHLFGFPEVTGIEVNPITVDLLKHVFRSYNQLADLPGTRLITAEARSWFARTTAHFDSVQMSMIDTWAATGAGAFSLTENGLYTLQAWQIFFDHLTPSGIFTVSRWYAPNNVAETGRMLSLALATLMTEHITDPHEHIFLAATDHLATLIVARAPFTPKELATLTAVADKLKFTILVSPQARTMSPILSEIMSATTLQGLNTISARYPLDFLPSTDDRPFFFNQLKATSAASIWLASQSHGGVLNGNLRATIVLGTIIVLSAILVLITTIVPSLPAICTVAPRIAIPLTLYFILIGFGFMFVEIGLIQRISTFLGHPIYGMSIGLFGIIVSTGLGSLCSLRFPLVNAERILLWIGTLGLYLLVLPYWLPMLAAQFASADLVIRAAISLTAILPSGVLMGFGFPTGMEMVNAIDSRPTPWLWAVNGAAGVLAAGSAVMVSTQFGISTTLWCAAASYLLLGPVALYLRRRPAPLYSPVPL